MIKEIFIRLLCSVIVVFSFGGAWVIVTGAACPNASLVTAKTPLNMRETVAFDANGNPTGKIVGSLLPADPPAGVIATDAKSCWFRIVTSKGVVGWVNSASKYVNYVPPDQPLVTPTTTPTLVPVPTFVPTQISGTPAPGCWIVTKTVSFFIDGRCDFSVVQSP